MIEPGYPLASAARLSVEVVGTSLEGEGEIMHLTLELVSEDGESFAVRAPDGWEVFSHFCPQNATITASLLADGAPVDDPDYEPVMLTPVWLEDTSAVFVPLWDTLELELLPLGDSQRTDD